MSRRDTIQPFSRRALAALLGAGIIGFLAYLLLTAYGPDMRTGRDGGMHAMSVAATGFRGLFRLNEEAGGSSYLIRDKEEVEDLDLLVLTPQGPQDASKIAELVKERSTGDSGPTLIILPKWLTRPDPKNRAWVQAVGVGSPELVAATLKEVVKDVKVTQPVRTRRPLARWHDMGIGFVLPRRGQAISGGGLETIVADPAGGAVLARLPSDIASVYVLADPDLADNLALKDRRAARAALEMLWALNPDDPGTISFDVTVPGYGRSPNLLKLAFEPPFLAVTLCLFAAALLAGLHALVRFGPALSEARAIAFGKKALLDNSADLLRRAGHEHRGGERYVALTRDAVAHAVGVPADLSIERIDHYLDRLGARQQGERWSDLARRAIEARTRNELVRAARALHDWRKEVTRGHR